MNFQCGHFFYKYICKSRWSLILGKNCIIMSWTKLSVSYHHRNWYTRHYEALCIEMDCKMQMKKKINKKNMQLLGICRALDRSLLRNIIYPGVRNLWASCSMHKSCLYMKNFQSILLPLLSSAELIYPNIFQQLLVWLTK